MILADNHCHILKQYYSEIDLVVAEAREKKLEYISCMGLDYETNIEVIALKRKFPDFVRAGNGLHPSEIISYGDNATMRLESVMQQIEKNISEIDVIGEIGIDFSYPDSRKYEESQVYCFETLSRTAVQYSLPVSIHCREAWNEIFHCIEKVFPHTSRNGYLHCFTGDFAQAKFLIEHGFKLGIGGIVTFKKSEKLRETLQQVMAFNKNKSFDELFGLETDAPFLSPEPHRSQKNSPETIVILQEFIHTLLNL